MNLKIKNIGAFCLAFLVITFANGQYLGSSTQVDLGFSPEFIDFSPDNKYMIAENENRYLVWNTLTNEKVLEGNYKFKIGRFIKNISIPTGSGFFLFGNEEVFLTVDYQHNQTEIKAFNLKDGSLLWESDQLDIGVSVAETVISAHAGGMVQSEINGATSQEAAYRANNFFTKDRFLDRLVNYIPKKNAIVLNGKKGLQLVDIRNGNTLWTQADFKGGIGELLFEAKTNRLIAITIPATQGAMDLLTTVPEVIALDAKTGEILWNVSYDGEFIPDYATVVGNTLILPYLELTLIDLKTGEERDGDVSKGLKAARNVSKGLGGLMALDKAMGGSFEASKGADSKYNRLIPRSLHFNENGKLCYFTMFNKKGAWGTGGKKGYLIIDIHQDKIEKQEYGILGQQWTEIQDNMADGIFYVKARGNMNRTIIKALNARTGQEVFETEKAKNSGDISKQFNPFMIDVQNNRLIDVVSKGVYVFDSKTGNKITYTSTKDLGVGTVNYSEFFPNGLLILGTKGVGIMDFEGNIVGSIAAKNIHSFAATKEEVWLLENKRFLRIDAQNGTIIEESAISKSDFIAIASSGKALAKIKGKKVEVFRK